MVYFYNVRFWGVKWTVFLVWVFSMCFKHYYNYGKETNLTFIGKKTRKDTVPVHLMLYIWVTETKMAQEMSWNVSRPNLYKQSSALVRSNHIKQFISSIIIVHFGVDMIVAVARKNENSRSICCIKLKNTGTK